MSEAGECGPSDGASFYPGVAAVHFSTAWNPGSLVAARITPLRLEAFEQLPKHARRCVYWEVDPSTLRADDHLSDPEFEKEAWLSMVMLEWGSCGQMAVHCRDSGPTAGDDRCRDATRMRATPVPGVRVLRAAGCGAARRRFPTGPVSADAVLLTSLGVESGHDSRGAVPQPDRSGGRRPRPPRRAGARGVRAYRRGDRTARPATGVARIASRRRGARRLLGRPVRARRRPACRTPASSSSRTTGTSRGCGSNSSRDWAGRPMSRRRWSGCWKPRSCSSRSVRARVPAPSGSRSG